MCADDMSISVPLMIVGSPFATIRSQVCLLQQSLCMVFLLQGPLAVSLTPKKEEGLPAATNQAIAKLICQVAEGAQALGALKPLVF